MLPKGGSLIWGDGSDAPDDQGDTKMGHLLSFSPNANMSALTDLFAHVDLGEVKNLTVSDAFDLLTRYAGPSYKRLLHDHYSTGIATSGLNKLHGAYDHPRYWTNPLESALPSAPNMTVYALYGVGKPVERSYFYRAEAVPGANDTSSLEFTIDLSVTRDERNLTNGVQDSDGDGTVTLLSLGYMPYAGWRYRQDRHESSACSGGETYGHIYNPGRVKIVLREYQHDPVPLVMDVRGGPRTGDYVDILGNHEVTMDILKLVTAYEDTIPERRLSNIDCIASRVRLKR
jgi:phospholipid:diacylglycerol acyltransferase